jgi:hypothetical protein
MTQRTRVHDEASAAEPKFYLPAGSGPSLVTGRLERVWTTLFDHGVEVPR